MGGTGGMGGMAAAAGMAAGKAASTAAAGKAAAGKAAAAAGKAAAAGCSLQRSRRVAWGFRGQGIGLLRTSCDDMGGHLSLESRHHTLHFARRRVGDQGVGGQRAPPCDHVVAMAWAAWRRAARCVWINARQPKVGQLDKAVRMGSRRARGREEDVLRLEVAVDGTESVDVRQAGEHLRHI